MAPEEDEWLAEFALVKGYAALWRGRYTEAKGEIDKLRKVNEELMYRCGKVAFVFEGEKRELVRLLQRTRKELRVARSVLTPEQKSALDQLTSEWSSDPQ